jgi:hypothetical protein
MRRNPFKKLITLIRLNAVTQDENGEWTKITSSTNRRKMQNGWIPSKLMLTEQDLRDIWVQQNGLCYWFKIPLNLDLLFEACPDYYFKHPLAPSVDKKDDKGDYTKDNVVICCRLANYGRQTYPFNRFSEIVDILKGQNAGLI